MWEIEKCKERHKAVNGIGREREISGNVCTDSIQLQSEHTRGEVLPMTLRKKVLLSEPCLLVRMHS